MITIIGSYEGPIQTSICAWIRFTTVCMVRSKLSHQLLFIRRDPSSSRGDGLEGAMGSIIIKGGRLYGDCTDQRLERYGRREYLACNYHCIYEITISNKVYLWHLIFDSNSTTYVAKYVISTKWIKLYPWIRFYPSVPNKNKYFLATLYFIDLFFFRKKNILCNVSTQFFMKQFLLVAHKNYIPYYSPLLS